MSKKAQAFMLSLEEVTETIEVDFPVIPTDVETPRDALTMSELSDQLTAIGDLSNDIAEQGQGSAATAQLLQQSLESLLAPMGLAIRLPSLESHTDDYNEYHRVACEGIGGFVTRLQENLGNWWKTYKDDFAYELKKRSGRLMQIERRIAEAEAFTNKRMGDLSKLEYRFNLSGVQRLFTVNNMVVNDLSKAINSDLKATQWVLHDHQNELAGAVKSLSGVLQQSAKTNEDVDKIVAGIAGIKHPNLHIPTSYLNGYPFMGNFGLQVKVKDGVKDPSFGELGKKTIVKPSFSLKFELKEALLEIIFNKGNGGARTSLYSLRLSPEDIVNSLGSLRAYAAVIREQMNSAEKNINLISDCWKGYSRMLANKDSLDKASVKRLGRIQNVLLQLADNISEPFDDIVDHAFDVMITTVRIQEQLGRALK